MMINKREMGAVQVSMATLKQRLKTARESRVRLSSVLVLSAVVLLVLIIYF